MLIVYIIATGLINPFTDIMKKGLDKNSTEMELKTEIPSVKDDISGTNLGKRIFKQKISPCEISSCIKKMKNIKFGTILMRFIKNVQNERSSSLAVLFIDSLSLGIFPKNLKIACLCPIYKGEGTRSNLDNYRPISVLPVEHHLHGFQSGFRQKETFYKYISAGNNK